LAKKEQASKGTGIQADDLISFRQLSKKSAGGDADDVSQVAVTWADDQTDTDLIRATGAEVQEDFVSKLSRIVQLTGFSDPVYAEAVVTIQQFDVVLEVLIVNQTTTTHQNLTIDFATLGDLKLVERPAPHTIGPHGFHHITATIKVSSTETGVIFGNATFDKEGASDSSVNIVLSDIQYVIRGLWD
jgi:coatomer subunit beta